jgi:hypothetical protein
MERFLKALLGHDVRFAFPRIWNTKGETLREFASKSSSDWQSTRSCWRNSQWSAVNGTLRQCGVCAACMLRRISVHAAGLEEERDVYVGVNMSAPTIERAVHRDFTRLSRSYSTYAIAGVLHMDHLAEMSKPDAAHLVKRHALFLGPAMGLDPKIAAEKLSALLQRHAAEWSGYLDHVGKDSFIRRWARYQP